MRFNRLWILLTLFMVGFLMHAYDAYAGCCVPFSQGLECQNAATQGECDLQFYTFNTQNCNLIPQECNPGCCCVTGGGQMLLNQVCTNLGGTFYYNVQEPQCNDHCNGQPLTGYLLAGIIKNNTNGVLFEVKDATVTLVDRGGVNTLSGDGGYFSFSNVAPGPVSILAEKGECSAELYYTLTQNTNDLEIVMNCCQYDCELGPCINGQQTNTCVGTQECAIPQYEENLTCSAPLCEWDCSEWNPPEGTPCPPGQTQRTRTCTVIQTPECVVGPAPDLTLSCGTSGGGATCGDGFINVAGEECDFNLTTGLGQSTCQAPYNNINWCYMSNCTCRYPEIPDDCVNEATGASNVQTLAVYNQRQLNVTWDLSNPCGDWVDNYMVYGCRNSTHCNFFPRSPALSNNIDDFLVVDSLSFRLYARNDYCFKIRTEFNSSVNSSIRVQWSDPSCKIMGDEVCLNPHPDKRCGTWQGQNGVLSCTPDNFVVVDPVCNAGTYCGTNELGELTCLTASACDRCNGLFGIFGYQGFEISDEGETLTCPGPSLTVIPEQRVASKGNIFGGCYLDYSYTSVDKTYSCENVTSCYDYKSRLSCEQDYCTRFQDGESNMCEWADYNEVFNQGVCRPKKEYVDLGLAIQNCSLCDDPFYNKIYGECTEDTCELYGYCFYKKSTGECLDGNYVTCDVYDNEADCTGGVPVKVDTYWTIAGGTTKIGGTNNLLNASNDSIGIGRCEWNDTATQKCYRNADNLNVLQSVQNGTDCKISPTSDTENKTRCERDVTPPITEITPKQYYGRIMDLSDAISVSDYWPLGDRSTDSINNRRHTWVYYSINSTPMYPRLVLPIVTNGYKIIIDDSWNQGMTLNFYYFAEDAAKNLENIKSFSFIFDKLYPDISLSTSLETFEGGFEWENGVVGNWSTNLYVNITLNSEISMPVVCHYNITPMVNYTEGAWEDYLRFDIPGSVTPPNNYITQVPGTLNTAYINLWPDRYKWMMNCVDDSGNNISMNGTHVIDGDLTINNPFPMDLTYRSEALLPLDISIHTTAPGTCRYSRTTSDYYSMENTYSVSPPVNGDYTHSDSIENVFAYELETLGTIPSGIYRIYTACDLVINGQNKIIIGEPSDIIRFAVDDLAPNTILKYINRDNNGGGDPMPFYNNETLEHVDLYLYINDSAPILHDGNDMSFGPQETYYCIASVLRNISCQMKLYNVTELGEQPIEFDYTEKYQGSDSEFGPFPQFCYYSRDLGMNQESTRCITLRFRNKDFAEPVINIFETSE